MSFMEKGFGQPVTYAAMSCLHLSETSIYMVKARVQQLELPVDFC